MITVGRGDQWEVDWGKPIHTAICGGVGCQITFETELVQRFGAKVFLFDPSPTGIDYVRNNPPPRGIHFCDVGLSGTEGKNGFSGPMEDGSWVAGGNDKFSCVTVKSFMRHRGLDSIDLMKLNIEGFEYGVIFDCLESKVKIRQIVVSFHDKYQGIPTFKTIKCVLSLIKHGYKPISKQRSAWTFVKD